MDDFELDRASLEQTLAELKTINTWLGGNKVTLSGLEKVLNMLPYKESYLIADMGCGRGDMLLLMAKWARKKNLKIEFIGVDANASIIAQAKQHTQAYKEISYIHANVFEDKWLEQEIDIVTATLFTHHLSTTDLQMLLSHLHHAKVSALVINDLHRHRLAYIGIRILTSLFSRSPMVCYDGPLSVLRSFTLKDWQEILRPSNWPNHSLKWFWAFRWQLLLWKD